MACAQRYSVGIWLQDMVRALNGLGERRAVIVGGTGLYLSALTEGLVPMPETPPALRALSQARIETDGIAPLIEELALEDPETLVRIDRHNPARIQRAWEVLRATGRGLADWQRDTPAPLLPRDACVCRLLLPQTPPLNARIERRFDAMIEEGALAEVEHFLASGIPQSLPAAKALGAKELAAHLGGACSLAEARAEVIAGTRRFAKRQRTWFRSRMAAWERLDPNSGKDLLTTIPRG